MPHNILALTSRILVTLWLAACITDPASAQSEKKSNIHETEVYELRTYTTLDGRLDALNARFRDHTVKLFKKHGMESLGYWTPTDGEKAKNTLIYVISHQSREAAVASWKAFASDPEWKKVAAESQKDGKILAKRPESVYMEATDYSPNWENGDSDEDDVFELRIYKAREGKLGRLDARFRDHTIRLFEKHGMKSMAYWHPMDEPDSNDTLIYIIKHNSRDAARKSWPAFLADPAWKKAARESGVGKFAKPSESIYMKATDYSARARTATANTARDRPNILFIAVDDLRPELKSYDGKPMPIKTKTPHLDRLAASGVQFTRAYCNQAVCGASRLSLMSGLYPEFTGERNHHVTGWRQRWNDVVTMNQHFKANGYTTVGLGKIYHRTNGSGADRENWTDWIQVGGNRYADPESQKLMNAFYRDQKNNKNGPSTEAADVDDDYYMDGQRAAEGVRQINRLSTSGKPFFLAVGFAKPHLPFNAPTKYWDLYKRDDFQMPENLGVPPGYPGWASNAGASELRNYGDIPRRATNDFPRELNLRLIHGYHACVSYMDHCVGQLLSALEKSGVADNTIVVFWGLAIQKAKAEKWAQLRKLPANERQPEQEAFFKARHAEIVELLTPKQMKTYREFQQARKKQQQP